MPEPACAFCRRDTLDAVLTETEHFYALADHAPLVEGHTLIIPKDHYACFGAVPADLDSELLALKHRVAGFLTVAYRAPVFFEHGVFHQSVYHAHLHAMPFGSLDLAAEVFVGGDAQPLSDQEDLRHWFRAHGHYFYLEMPPPASGKAIFPPDEARYWQVLGALRRATLHQTPWQPQSIRHQTGRPLMRRVQEQWRAYSGG